MKKNLLIIYTDQQRSDTLGCYGNPKVITPNIDSLATDGVLFENYYVTNPVCAPSRASFLTGKYPSELCIGDNGHIVSEEIKNIADYFNNENYKTANIGKLHFLPHCNRTHQPGEHPSYRFDTMINSDEPGCYNDDYIRWVESKDKSQIEKVRCGLPTEALEYGHIRYTDRARSPHQPYIFEGDEKLTHSAFVTEKSIEFMDSVSDQPFMCIAGFYAPHAPINPNQVDIEKFKNIEFDGRIYNQLEEEFLLPSYKDLSNISEQEWKKIIKYYHALTHHVDNCVGEIIDYLKRSGKYDDTIIVFTTDHGEYLGDHNRVHKGMPGHDIITKVPMIIANCNQQQGKVKGLMSAVDFLPTICELLDVEYDCNNQGVSQVPVINGKIDQVRDSIIIQSFNTKYQGTTIRYQNYKYYVDNEGREILFDVINNPQETINYAADDSYSLILSEIKLKLIKELMAVSYSKQEKIAPY